MPEEALINHRNLVNHNKTFWETRLHVGIPWFKQSIICWKVDHLSTSVTSGGAVKVIRLGHAGRLRARLGQQDGLTGCPERRCQSHGCGMYIHIAPLTHKGRGPGETEKQLWGDGTPTAVLIQFCVFFFDLSAATRAHESVFKSIIPAMSPH